MDFEHSSQSFRYGKTQAALFATERQASAEAERLKTRAHNFGASQGNLTSLQIIEAADCYELLAPFPEARLKDAVLHYRETLKARAKRVTYQAAKKMKSWSFDSAA